MPLNYQHGLSKNGCMKKRISRCEHAAWNWLPRKPFFQTYFITIFFFFLFWRSFILGRQMFVLPSRISKLLLRISFGSSFAILHLLFSFFGFKILGSSFYSFQQLTLLYTHPNFFSLAHLHPTPPPRFLFIVLVHVFR